MMKFWHTLLWGGAATVFAAAALSAADANSTNAAVGSPPVYVPDTSHANEPLPDGVLAWDNPTQSANLADDEAQAHFAFSFTNVSSGKVAILDAHASCGCTQPELPQKPWIIPPGSNGVIGATVHLQNMTGTLIKSLKVSTDRGSKDLFMRITLLPPVLPTLTDAERARDVEIARADRQAVFKGDCVKCHAKSIEGKYGKPLCDAVCGTCHNAASRASLVPDLHNLKTSTSEDFWRTWIAHGKPGSLMPAFSTAEGGPLSDMQIATLAAYLNASIPPHPAPAAQ